MKLSYVMIVSAVANLIFGIGLVLAPGPVVALFGAMAMERITEQLFGTELLGFAALNWFGRNTKEGEGLRAIVVANLVANTVGFVLTLLVQLSGVWNAFGWIAVVVPFLFALGFAYYLFIEPSVAPGTVAGAQH